MKLIKTLAIAAVTLAAASLASADIYIVGSNGDRSATQKGILNKLAANGSWFFRGDKGSTDNANPTTNKNALNSNFGVWTGTFNSQSVKIKVSFIGAAGAVYALAGNNQVRFVANNGTGSGTLLSPYDPAAVLNTDYILANASFGFSTNFQETTPYNGGSYDTLVTETVGVSPIVFVASPGFPGDNLSTQLAQNLYSGGSLPASLFTGNAADLNKIVYAIGRNTDAGQRYASYSEFGLGTAAAVKVWKPALSGQITDPSTSIKYGGTVTSHQLWPIETVSGVDSAVRGNGGYDSGGNLAPQLTVTGFDANPRKGRDTGSPTPNAEPYPGATAAYYIGYVTSGDYNTRILPFSPSSVLLKYNGVAYSADAVRNGYYTAWVYNRILARSDNVGLEDATTSLFHDQLRDEILNTTATENGGILLGTLNVERFADGGLVTPK
ncbi:MAG: hypothetical protein WC003_10060 [Terrimicrobiaceae bacterium]